MKIQFTQSQAKKIVSKDKFRPSMHGVYFDRVAMALVLTDGHKMIKVDVSDCETLPEESFIIPVEALPANKKEAAEAVYTFYDGKIIKTLANSVQTFEPIDERFPDWQSVWPQEVSPVEKMGFNLRLFEETNAVVKAFCPDVQSVKLNFHGERRAVSFETLQDGTNVSGLLMPLQL